MSKMCSQLDLGWSSKVTGLETFSKLKTQTQNLLGLGLGSGLGTELGVKVQTQRACQSKPKAKRSKPKPKNIWVWVWGLHWELTAELLQIMCVISNSKSQSKQTQNPKIPGFGSWVWIWNRNWKLGLEFAELLSCHQKLKVTYQVDEPTNPPLL